ncbi:DUF397 domain-containing protein [Streptomyces sp. NBC_01506]|uniref:DUF397 domain-containing protein n=1 Tax=Streptomyces sp. NBC_01506 TaxID=2903887 RepID=UPI00386B4AE4
MTHRIATDVAPESAWFKSSYSSENGTACVEVADLTATAQVGIRDSKHRAGPALVVPVGAWMRFVSEAQYGF